MITDIFANNSHGDGFLGVISVDYVSIFSNEQVIHNYTR